MGLWLVMKLIVPLMIWVLIWFFVGPSYPSWNTTTGVNWLRICSQSLLRLNCLYERSWKDNVACHPFSKGEGDCHWLYIYHKCSFVDNYCIDIYPSFYLLTLFTSIYPSYIEWIHVIWILQIRKFQLQVWVALYNWLVVIQIPQIQPVSCIGQAKHVGWSCSLSYW